jgi:hypothetical protein
MAHPGSLRSLSFPLVALLASSGCGDSADSPSATPTDYSRAESWETLPNASQAVDVFFLYPTTYSAPSGTLGATWSAGWNQTITDARADTKINFHVTSKAAVFARAGTNLYAPYYQQASGLDALNALLYGSAPQNEAAASAALQVAYRDVANAFDYYLAHFNKDASGHPRPFILAGHSQGSNLLLMLLEDKFTDPALRSQLVVAYVIGWSVTAEDMDQYPNSLQQLGICGIPETRTTGCIVTYNTQAYAGDWTQAPGAVKYGIAKPNSYSVNPLTWAASGPGEADASYTPASANMGALFYKGSLGTAATVPFALNPDTGDYTYEIATYTGAQSDHGGLVVNPSAFPAPGDQANLALPYSLLPMFHNYDYTFFYRNLEQNVIDRISDYDAQ